MGQLTPKRWKRLHVENLGDRRCKKISPDLLGVRAGQKVRGVDPDDRTFKRPALEYVVTGVQATAPP